MLSRFTEQGPQRHFALIKREIGLDYIKYAHDPEEKGHSTKSGQNECRCHAKKPGSCKFGNKCRFEHANRGKNDYNAAVKFVTSKSFKRTIKRAVNQVLKKQKKATDSSSGTNDHGDGFQIISGVTVQLKNDMRKGFLSKHGVASIAQTDSFLVNVDSGAACGVANLSKDKARGRECK